MSDTDESLVERGRRGDRAAFEELVRRTARLVYVRLAMDVPDRHRAEDLAQEVYLIAWRSIGQLHDASRLRPWLMTIAASVVTDDIKSRSRKKRGRRPAAGDALEAVADSGVDPAASAESVDDQQRALAALRSLPDEYSRPLALCYLAGADYDTIATQLALTNGSLRGLLHRGMAMLRKKMKE